MEARNWGSWVFKARKFWAKGYTQGKVQAQNPEGPPVSICEFIWVQKARLIQCP